LVLRAIRGLYGAAECTGPDSTDTKNHEKAIFAALLLKPPPDDSSDSSGRSFGGIRCIGGADMRTVFVTTAAFGMSDSETKEEPMAGGVFAISTDVDGVEKGRFGNYSE
jgi:hypothetical protein